MDTSLPPLPPLEPIDDYFARTENLSKEEQFREYEKRSALMKLYAERKKKEREREEMLSSPVYRQMVVDKSNESQSIKEAIDKLASKIAVAKEQHKATHTIDTTADEFMLAKWEADKQTSLVGWDRTIASQLDQIEQMKAAFEMKLRAVENNLEGTRNTRAAKASYFDKRIQATRDRIELANSYNKTPVIVKMELELQQLEAKRAACGTWALAS